LQIDQIVLLLGVADVAASDAGPFTDPDGFAWETGSP
jgi:hypothetical protein